MRERLRSHLTYANVISTLCLFLVLGGGSAVAISGANTVFSDDIVDNQVFSSDVRNDTLSGGGLISADVRNDTQTGGGLAAADLRPSSVGTSEATNNSLTGTDIDESSLGEVPSATLGGLGGDSGASPSCNPESTTLETCSAVGGIDLPAPSRVLIIGQIRAEPDTGGGNGGGSCEVVSDLGGQLGPLSPVFVNGGQTDVMAISGVTGIVGPGPTTFFIYCNETASGIRYFNGHVSAVALSPG